MPRATARITEDIAPSVGNLDGVLKGNIDAYLTWDSGPVTTDCGQRIDGTSTVQGGALVLNPPTTVAVYNSTTGKLVGTAQVDTTGAWSLRPRSPFRATQDLARNITVVSSRGA